MENEKKKASDKKNVFVDVGSLKYSELYEDLRENRNDYLVWLLEEFDVHFEEKLKNLSEDNVTKFRSAAKRLLPYFRSNLKDENRTIRESCKLGIEQIKNRFPELIEE